MPSFSFKNVERGATDADTIQTLIDAYYRMKRELEFMFTHLEEDNMNKKTFDGYIQRLAAGTVVADIVVTKTLYADLGTIADLTVNSLSTANIIKGLDTMQYVDIEGQYIVFRKAVKDNTKPQKQLENKNKEKLYWEDSTQKLMSTTVTTFPVMVYQYDVYDKLKIYYDTNETVDYPIMIWGTGNGVQHGDFYEQQAVMYKDDTGFTTKYIQDGGDELDVTIGESGVTINGNPFRKITSGTADPSGGNDGDIYFKVVS